ncbi:hypothetical protein P9251_14305 [Metabacillus fastidiosus]|nr:hypothetical protein [Metabacillus fastidiosus]
MKTVDGDQKLASKITRALKKDQVETVLSKIDSICMEYVEDRADKVYVYASREEGVIASDFFI